MSGASELTPADIASYAADLTGEPISASDVSLQTDHGPSYQKLPLPALRVDATKADLFFEPSTGELLTQTTPARWFENLMKTIHVMDYGGGAVFRANWLLTAAAALFLLTAMLGVLSTRTLLALRKMRGRPAGLRSLRWHQALGLLLGIQVLAWVTSGLSVVWLLEPSRASAEEHLAGDRTNIAMEAVRVHPSELDSQLVGDQLHSIELTQLGEGPVYRLRGAGRSPRQELWSAADGKRITLTSADRDAIVAESLIAPAANSITRWEEAHSPADLDFYFYTGPYPVWKGFFDKPTTGAVAIDQSTGLVHTPRTDWEIFIERYYNLHVVNWRFGVIRYRLEPALLAVIGLALIQLVTGGVLQYRRLTSRRRGRS